VELLRQFKLLLSTSSSMTVGGDFNVSVARLVSDSWRRVLKRLAGGEPVLPWDFGTRNPWGVPKVEPVHGRRVTVCHKRCLHVQADGSLCAFLVGLLFEGQS